MSRPNVLWIITDDQTRDLLPVMQQTGVNLVEAGANFSNGYAAVPWCGPARASMLSGMYVHNHLCYTNMTHPNFVRQGLDQDTIATRMHAAGYATGYFGKYMNGHYTDDTYVAPGWDRFVALFGAETNESRVMFPDLTETEIPINVDGTVDVITQYWGSGDKVAAKHLCNFVKAHPTPADPWFAVFAPTAPHRPYNPSQEHSDDFDGATWNPPALNEKDMTDKPPWIEGLPPLDREAMRAEWEGRAEELQDTDDQISSILTALDESGQASNTVVMLVSDNGYLLGEHRLHAKKQPYEEATNVPFVVWGPGISPGTPSPLVSQVDLMPTTLDLAGLDPDAGRVLDGRSMLGPLRTGDWSNWRKRLLSENPHYGWAMLREDNWSYIRHYGGPAQEQTAQELYDLSVDPAQMSNLAGTGSTTVKAELKAKVDQMRLAKGLDLRELEVA